jgi:hypothetical protein
MRTGALALAGGLRRVRESWGLGILLLVVNLGTALILAVPLASMLARDLSERPSGTAMMRGFDYPWWSHWADTREGYAASLSPDLLGQGFAMKNLDLLLKGQLPAGLFAVRDVDGKRPLLLDPLLLALAAAYMLAQVFLSGGVLSVLRQAQGRWTVRGLLHGAGFYCGRFSRVWALMLLAAAILFALYGPFARWADDHAREAVSETSAASWLLGRHAVLLLALVFLHVVGTYARVIIVLEERSSALLAVLSALAFALANLLATIVIAGGLALLGLLALALWQAFDQAWTATGFRTQALTLLAMQGLVLARILLRVALGGALMDLYRRRTLLPLPAQAPR